MIKIKKTITLTEQLKEVASEKDIEAIKNGIANIFKEMGYSAISEEIKNNRKAKSNALYGLNMYYRGLVSDRWNFDTNTFIPVSEDIKDKADNFNMIMKSLIYKFLDDGTEKQQTYLKLMDKYRDESFKLDQAMFKLDELDWDKQGEEVWNRAYDSFMQQKEATDKAKNELDNFVLINLK